MNPAPCHPIVVLVSGSGSNMEALAGACERGLVPGRLTGVLADRECEGIERARRRGIAVQVLAPKAFATRAEWNLALRDAALRPAPDLVVSAGFMRILAPSFVDAFPGRLINLHPALLPDFPGAHAVQDALTAGVAVTGATVHHIDYQVDHGEVILQAEVEVLPGDDSGSLHARIKEAEHELLPRACALLLSERDSRRRSSGAAGAATRRMPRWK